MSKEEDALRDILDVCNGWSRPMPCWEKMLTIKALAEIGLRPAPIDVHRPGAPDVKE